MSDIDGVNDIIVVVMLGSGCYNSTDGKDFVIDKATLSTISGSVKEDTDNDGTGNVNLPSVVVTLLNESGMVVGTTPMDLEGNFEFVGVPPGMYVIVQTPT